VRARRANTRRTETIITGLRNSSLRRCHSRCCTQRLVPRQSLRNPINHFGSTDICESTACEQDRSPLSDASCVGDRARCCQHSWQFVRDSRTTQMCIWSLFLQDQISISPERCPLDLSLQCRPSQDGSHPLFASVVPSVSPTHHCESAVRCFVSARGLS
jgi:hypothetical protein